MSITWKVKNFRWHNIYGDPEKNIKYNLDTALHQFIGFRLNDKTLRLLEYTIREILSPISRNVSVDIQPDIENRGILISCNIELEGQLNYYNVSFGID